MKKVLSLVLSAILVCGMILAVSAEKPNETAEVLKFTTAPNLDGVITEAEWGKANAHVTADYKTAYFCDKDGADENSSFDLWLRWDANYYYVGVVAPDDIHALAKSEGSLWNGDAIQMGFDPNGPISSGDVMSPWTQDDDTGYSNMAFGLVSGEGDTLSSWAWYGPAKGGNDSGAQVDGAKYNIKHENNATTYEIAIPWASIGVKEAKAGDVYGATIVRVLCDSEDDGYNGWLTWGTGICGPQDEDEACGSNAIKLSDTAATAAAPASTEGTAEAAPAADDKAEEAPAAEDKAEEAPAADGAAAEEAPAAAEETTTPEAPKTADAGLIAVIAAMAASAGAALSIKKRK